ncbi:unnamed protein product [Ectocarpus sp. 6 AP-2014]
MGIAPYYVLATARNRDTATVKTRRRAQQQGMYIEE